jgi:hypothetical protein
MMEVLDRIERELVDAAGRRVARRRVQRRALIAGALALLALAAASVASAVTGEGPLASMFGVREGDPNLRAAKPTPGGERAVVRAESPSGQRWVFGFFESDQPLVPARRNGSGFCFTPLAEGRGRLEGLGCGTPRSFAREIARHGFFVSAWGIGQGGERSGVLGTAPVYGLVPADVRQVTVQAERRPALRANLSRPFTLRQGRDGPAETVRAFLAVVESVGDVRLTGFTSLKASVELADGSVRSKALEVAVGFPLAADQRFRASAPHVKIGASVHATRWRMVAYKAEREVLCVSPAPPRQRLISAARLQCSGPFAVIRSLQTYGVAAYASESEPPGGGVKRGSYTVLGHARADAREVTVIDQRGRRWQAELSPTWTTARRLPGDLHGIRGPLRMRLERLPQTAPLRSFLVAIPAPPGPSDGDGLRLQVTLADGQVLRQP